MKVRDILMVRPQTEEISRVNIPLPQPMTPRVQPAPSPCPAPATGNRDFLSRPACQEDTLSIWEAWAPFMDWLHAHYPERFMVICEAEDTINHLERQGVMAGPEHEAACQELVRRFEAGRRLRFRESVKVWVQ